MKTHFWVSRFKGERCPKIPTVGSNPSHAICQNAVEKRCVSWNSCEISKSNFSFRAVFKKLSKFITRLRLLQSVSGLKIWVFQPMRSKTKTNRTLYARFFPRFEHATRIGKAFDWFIALIVFVVIGRSSYFGLGSSAVIWS